MAKKALEGLPVFSFEDGLKAAGLATVGMLKRDRRRPADGQEPAAKYWTAYEYAPLYTAADAVDLPPLSPGRQRRYDEARTCARCGAKRKTPFAKGPDGKRYCEPCQEPAAKDLFDREQAARRTASAEWAREVLADPRVVLVEATANWHWLEILATKIDGTVLLNSLVRLQRVPREEIHEDYRDRVVEASQVLDAVRELADCRLISWWGRGLSSLARDMRAAGLDPGGDLDIGNGDEFGRRYGNWLGKRYPGSYRHNREVESATPPIDGVERIVQMRAALVEMAGDDRG